MMQRSDKQRDLERKEREFLEACGFDLRNGYWSEDVKYYKEKHPELYKEYMR